MLPVPHIEAPTVKLPVTGREVVPAIGSGSEGLPLSRRVRLNDNETASQSFSTVVLMTNRGVETDTGMYTSLQLGSLGYVQPRATSAKVTRHRRKFMMGNGNALGEVAG